MERNLIILTTRDSDTKFFAIPVEDYDLRLLESIDLYINHVNGEVNIYKDSDDSIPYIIAQIGLCFISMSSRKLSYISICIHENLLTLDINPEEIVEKYLPSCMYVDKTLTYKKDDFYKVSVRLKETVYISSFFNYQIPFNVSIKNYNIKSIRYIHNNGYKPFYNYSDQ